MDKPHDQCPSLRSNDLHTLPERAQDQGVQQEWIKHFNRDDFIPKTNTSVGFGPKEVSDVASIFAPKVHFEMSFPWEH